MATDREILKYRQSGQAQTYGCVDPTGEVGRAHSYPIQMSKAADDAMASTTTAETYLGKTNLYKARVKNVYYNATTGGITADNTNFATVTIKWRDSTGGNPVTIATLTTTITSSGNVTQGAPIALVLSQANVVITALGSFTLTIAKSGSGVVVRAGEFVVELENV